MAGSTRLRMLAAVLSVLMASASGFEVAVDPSSPKVGDDVHFYVTGINEDLRFSEWYQGAGIPAENQIIRYNTGTGTTNRGAKFREEFEIFPNGSLLIKNVKKEMAGLYTVNIQGRSQAFQKTVNLTVVDPGLGAGAIAGIVVGALAVVVAAIAIGVYFFQKSKKDSGPL